MINKEALAAGQMTRVQGGATQVTIKDAPGILHRIVIMNADVAAQTLTLFNDTTTLIVFSIAAGVAVSLEINAFFDTNIKVTPSDANIDALVMWD